MREARSPGLYTIGVFYDGQYFFKVSNYYAYQHERKSRIAIGGLHDFIRNRTADSFGVAPELCSIVDAHYFRGRLAPRDASTSNALFNERVFDDILTGEGVTTHYLPLATIQGRRQEKGIDVWLALEAYELSMYKRFDMVALIVCDSDYMPLVRKLHALGIRVMLLSWNLKFREENGEEKEIKTSQELLQSVNVPLRMHDIVESHAFQTDARNSGFFISAVPSKLKEHEPEEPVEEPPEKPPATVPPITNEEGFRTSEIVSINRGYGFIREEPNNIFFHHSGLAEGDFYDLYRGDTVQYRVQLYGERLVAVDVKKIEKLEK